MEFHKYLEGKNLFTADQCSKIVASFRSESFQKGDKIIKPGATSDRLIFIESGLVRAYQDKDGKDITHFFFSEDHFIAPANTLLYNKAERYELEALENCEIKTIRYMEFLGLGEKYPRLMTIALEFAIKMCDFLSYKLDIVKFERAYDKYNRFLEMYPNLKNRVSLGDTASFLGITQQTLSVVRGQTQG